MIRTSVTKSYTHTLWCDQDLQHGTQHEGSDAYLSLAILTAQPYSKRCDCSVTEARRRYLTWWVCTKLVTREDPTSFSSISSEKLWIPSQMKKTKISTFDSLFTQENPLSFRKQKSDRKGLNNQLLNDLPRRDLTEYQFYSFFLKA